ncbi:MAG: HlyD family efflux transporter periplasmic adaptor subunit, partial [Bacteroidota bacterium]
ELLKRLEEQIYAKEASLDAKEAKGEALERQIGALREAMKFKIKQAENKVLQMNFKVTSDSTDFQAEKVNFDIATKQFDRQQKLYDQGLKSLTELESRRLKYQEAQAKLISVENKFLGSKNERVNAIIQLSTLEAEFLDKISKAESDLGETRAGIFETGGSIAKLKNEYANMRIRNDQYHILAPQDGYVVQAQLAGLGETIKEGEPIVTIMPESPDIAVEMYVKAMDVPLLTKGRKVRIEFDGWPALQFSGWPNVAVGTFGGVISVIDYVNSKGGMFRILVTPDPEEETWPKQLRLGSGVKGWAMLDEVPVWYEIWRQLNGFPPSLEQEPQMDDTKVAKK